MSENDYILSLMAIVSGLAITHMIASLYGILARRSVVVFDLLALTAATTAYAILYGWWVTWAAFHLRTGPLPFWRFLMPILSVTALVLAARAALPDHIREQGVNLRQRYDDHGVWIWRALLASACILTLGIIIRRVTGEALGGAAASLGLPGVVVMVSIFAILGWTRNRRVHSILVPGMLALQVATTITQNV